ncbi:MAG: hypothetical protein RRY10_04470, partial [Christensenellaceae bacterium]
MKRKMIASLLAVVLSVTLVGGSISTAFAQNENIGETPAATPDVSVAHSQAEPNAAEPSAAAPNAAEPNAVEPNAAEPSAAEP